MSRVIAMTNLLYRVRQDPRYSEGLRHGKPRESHQEGTVGNHIAELEDNLEALKDLLSDYEYWTLKVLIHVHDIMKYAAVKGGSKLPIIHPESHASLAKKFLAEFTNDEDLLRMVQYHDEGHALYCRWRDKGTYKPDRMANVLSIHNLPLFLLFVICDGFTVSKDHSRIRWLVEEVIEQTPGQDFSTVCTALDRLGI